MLIIFLDSLELELLEELDLVLNCDMNWSFSSAIDDGLDDGFVCHLASFCFLASCFAVCCCSAGSLILFVNCSVDSFGFSSA